MDLHTLCVQGAFVIEGSDFTDERGSFRELFLCGKLWKDLPLTHVQQVSTLDYFFHELCPHIGKCII